MVLRGSRISFTCLLFIAQLVSSASILAPRADVNLTSLANGTSIIESLDYTSNCTLATIWFNNLPNDGAGSSNDTINVAFLRSALPPQYQSANDSQIGEFYDDMSIGALSNIDWLGTAIDDIQVVCIAPIFEKQVTLAQLDATQNCTATAKFLSSLGWLGSAKEYTGNQSNDTSWVEFLYYSLPVAAQKNITNVELYAYYDHFLDSEEPSDINTFLQAAFSACQDDICEVQGYTGNPDIGGIGVLASYNAEAILVTLYFIATNIEIWIFGIRPLPDPNPSRFAKAFRKASDELLDGALFFSLSISTAGWVSFHSGRSFYEKLVYTSANILALSALFAFLALFPGQGLQKRGWVLVLLVAGILVEGSIQYIVYLTESNTKYDDYLCLHRRFETQGYHPRVFEALFFLLVGLSVICGIIALVYKLRHKEQRAQRLHDHAGMTSVEKWAFAVRIFVEVVAITVVWVECVYLWKIRHIMASVAGDSWSEGAWGFGQILALFIWFPPFLDILGTALLPTWMTGNNDTTAAPGGEGDKELKTVLAPSSVPSAEKRTAGASTIAPNGK